MKRIALLIIVALLNINISAQTNDEYEYLHNPQLAMSDDGLILAISGRIIPDPTARLGSRYLVDFYDATTGNLISTFDGSEDSITSLSLNAEGTLFAYSNNGGRLGIVNVQTGHEIKTIVEGGSMEVGNHSWHPHDNLFAVISGRGVAIYNTESFVSYGAFVHQEMSSIGLNLDWHPIEPKLAVTIRDTISELFYISIWHIDTEEGFMFEQSIEISAGSRLAWNDAGSAIVINQRGGVQIIDLIHETHLVLEISDSDEAIRSVGWSPDNSMIAGGGNQSIYIWDVESQAIIEIIKTNDIVRDLYWSPDGEFIYHTGGVDGIYRNGVPLKEAILDAEQNE